MMEQYESDSDLHKGAVEQDKPEQQDNTSLSGQLPHRPDNKLIEGNDTDFPELGENPEHSGEPVEASMDNKNEQSREQENKREENPEGKLQDQDPGFRQKQNQSDKKEDDLAA